MPKLNAPKASYFSVIAVVTVLLFFQNCSEVNFDTDDELFLKEGIIATDRFVEFGPGFKSPPEIQVNAIIDDSASMELIQTQVQNALSTTTSILKGFEGSVQVYTTSQGTNEVATLRQINIQDLVGNWIFIDPSKLPDYISNSSPYSYFTVDSYNLQPKFPSLSYNAFMTDVEFNNFAVQFADQVKQVGVSGSDKEQGICALLRLAKENKNDGKFHAYIIATNEDDQTDWSSCLDKKQTKTDNVRLVKPITELCSPGEAGCNHKYTIPYDKSQNSQVKYSYQNNSSKIRFKNLTPVIGYRGTISYYESKLVADYKQKLYRVTFNYTGIDVRDGIPYPGVAKSYSPGNLVGLCSPGDINRDCTETERVARAAHPEYACKVACADYSTNAALLTSNQNVTLTGYSYGWKNVSDYTLASSNCKDVIKSEKNINHVVDGNCSFRVSHTGRRTSTKWLSNSPNTCSNPNTKFSCTLSEKSELQSKSNNAFKNAPDNALSCESWCTVSTGSIKEKSITAPTGNCDGRSTGNFGTSTYSCSESELSLARNELGVSGSTNIWCQKQCTQSEVKRTFGYNSVTTCSSGTSSCSDAQASEAAGLAAGPVTKCELSCRDNSTPSACVINTQEQNLCAKSSADLIASYGCSDRGQHSPLLTNSCSVISSKNSIVDEYKKSTAPEENIELSHDDGDTEVVAAAKTLQSAHGKLFYIATFNIPKDDTLGCDPEYAALSRGEKYEELSSLVGENAKTYPVCLDDYAPSFSNIFNVIKEEALKSYKLDINEAAGEFVYKVTVTFADGRIEELDGTLFSVSGGTLTFADTVPVETALNIKVLIKVPLKENI